MKFRSQLWKICVIYLLFAFILNACITPREVIQTVEVTRLVPQILVATFVIKETVLVTQEPAVLPTSTASMLTQAPVDTATPSPTATISIGFPNARVNSYGFRSNGDFFITVDTGTTLSGDYIAIVGNQEYSCELVPKYPERLYCYGPLKQYGRIISLIIFKEGEVRTPLFETEFMAPLKSTATPTPTSTLTVTTTP